MNNPITPNANSKNMTKEITLTASVWPEEDGFVSQCVEYDVSSCGDTEEEALDNLIEAVELYLEDPTPTVAPRIVLQFKVEAHAA